jgi:hypothetical protein
MYVLQGGSDPRNFLGGGKPEKWGRSRPILLFAHGDFLPCCCCIYRVPRDFAYLQGEERDNLKGAERNSYSLHSTLSESAAGAARRSKKVLKPTLCFRSFVPTCCRISLSLMQPFFHPRYKPSNLSPVNRARA